MKFISVFLLIAMVLSLSPVYGAEEILNGKILEINKKFKFIIIDLGEEDGVESGMVFMVYRDRKLLGKVVADEIFPEMSSCNLLPGWDVEDFKIDDGVMKS